MYLCICSDTEKLQSGIGEKLFIFVGSLSNSLAGIVVAFVYSWKLTLFMTAFLPLLVIIFFLTAKVITAIAAHDLKPFYSDAYNR